VLVKDINDIGDLAVGAHHACILFGEGDAAKCWGWNEYGQLGNDSLTDSNLPVLVYPPAR
jgi:alpha-tubulin suppressor-like RCC1 family protein